MKPHPQLIQFLSPYDESILHICLGLRKLVLSNAPEANELIWNNYNAVAIAYSKSERLKDAFCHISVYPKHVNFGFNRGAELKNHLVTLEGKGKLIRHYKVTDLINLPKIELGTMINEAISISEILNPELALKTNKGESLIQSIAKKKLRPPNKS